MTAAVDNRSVNKPDLSPLHVVAQFDNPYTGAERRLLELRDQLVGIRAVHLWSVVPPHPTFQGLGVRPIRPFAREAPFGGMLLIGGVHVRLDALWLRNVKPQRLVLSYNLPSHDALFAMIEQLREATGMDPELLFVSRALQWTVGLPGTIEHSLIPLDSFLKIPVTRPAGRGFTVGRLSRDVPEKHDPLDPALYRQLAANGLRVRLMGATCLAAELGNEPGIELLPEGAETASAFLQSLDLMFYRTGIMPEAYGRVIFEAMATGLPVVTSNHGGYTEFIEPGRNGFIVNSQEEAFNAITLLARDSTFRQTIGTRAREVSIALHGPDAVRASLEFYTR